MRFADLLSFRRRTSLEVAVRDSYTETGNEALSEDQQVEEIKSILDKGEITDADMERLARLIGNA